MKLAPIILFVYNRPWHTLQTLEALSKNELADQSTLYVFADGPKENASADDIKKISEVEKTVRGAKWCKEVIFIKRDRNYGLADNIVSGVTQIIQNDQKVIVLEDDIITSKGFLKYMNDALDVYAEVDKVMHIAGYVPTPFKNLPSTFFYNQTSCWGWATWARAWRNYDNDAAQILNKIKESFQYSRFDIDGSYPFTRDLEHNASGKMKTWAVKWHGSVFINNGLCLHPHKSLVQNIGTDGTGTNSGESAVYKVEDTADFIDVSEIESFEENVSARNEMASFYYKIGISSTPYDPFTGSKEVTLIRQIPSSQIVEKYQTELNIDVSKYFESTPIVKLYKSNKADYCFYYPFNISGDGMFYASLQDKDWYYMPWKWEHDQAYKYVKDGMTVLEVGCAQGEFIERISKSLDVKVVGLELNDKAVRRGIEKKLDIRNEAIQLHSKNFQDHYDLVCSFQVLEHIADVNAFLRSQLACLKKGGLLIISVPNNGGFLGDSENTLNMPPHHMGLWNEKSLLYLQTHFPIKHLATHYEPLQTYHLEYFNEVVQNKYRLTSSVLKGIINKSFIRDLLFSKKYQAFTIQVVFIKV